jgi:oligopeptide transport system substrate-binding protein
MRKLSYRSNAISWPASNKEERVKIRTKHARLVAAVGLLGALLVSGHQASAQPASSTLPTLRWYGLVGQATGLRTLDPIFASDANSIYTMYMVDANLVKVLPSGNVAPDLATWKVSPNHRVYTFTIRPNARFNNGDPVTAADVKFSLTRSLAKSSHAPLSLSYLGHIVGAKALNDGKTNVLSGVKVLNTHQVQITVDKPIAFFLGALSYETGDILDPKIVAGKPTQSYLVTTCSANVGAGPFMFVCRNKNSDKSSFYAPGTTPTYTLVPNPYYYGKKPHIQIQMKAIATIQTNYETFRANGIDVTYVPGGDISANRDKPGFYSFPTSNVDYITPNYDEKPFSNIHCRLAVAYAIDRDAINRDVLHGSQVSIYDVVPRGMLGYYNGADNPHYSVAKAKAELAKCPGGIHNAKVVYGSYSTDNSNEYAALQSMWSAVGISVKLTGLPQTAWVDTIEKPLVASHTDLAQELWYQDYPDPQDYCTLLLRGHETWNTGGFNDPYYNKLVDQADVTFNKQKRAALYIKAQHYALSTGAWISVGNTLGYAMVKPWVHGLVGNEPFIILMPRNNDWSNVTISPH